MSTSPEPRREHPSTYWVQDRSNQHELMRLQIQDQLTTTSMGGVLPEQNDPTAFRHILDVGCGTGGWLIETATTYPSIKRLVGGDVSKKMLEYAAAQAEAAQVSDRVEFHVMDALRLLEFPDDSFDLVNLRFGQSFLRTWDWPKLLQEMLRVSRRGGVIRLTEADIGIHTSSPALNRLGALCLQALYQAGHYFDHQANGLTSHLARLLEQHGGEQVQTRAYTLEYRAGTPEGQHLIDDAQLVYRTIQPFLRKWLRVPDDYEQLYRQMVSEVQQPDFVATWSVVTAWGLSPAKRAQAEHRLY